MKFGDLTFNTGKTVDTDRYSLMIPDGFQTEGDLSKSFTAWIPSTEKPKDPETSDIVLTSSVYNAYRKNEMTGITARSVGKMAQLRALESQNHERDADKRFRSFTYGNVSGVFNVVSFSGSRNYYPTVFLPAGTQQFHIRINDPMISDAQVVHFMEQWLGTMTVKGQWNESIPINAPYMKSLALDSDTIAFVRENLERRMQEEYLSFTIDCQLVQEKIGAEEQKAGKSGSTEEESDFSFDTVMDRLEKAREDYASAIDSVISESADYIRTVSAENPESAFLFPLVEAIRDANPIEEVKQTINGTEYATPVHLAAKKKELFTTPEIQVMLDAKEEENRKREEARRKQLEKQRAVIQSSLEELEEKQEALLKKKEEIAQDLAEKKSDFYQGLPDIEDLEEKVESQSGVISGLVAQKNRLSALQHRKRKEADRLIAQSQEDYAELKAKLDEARKQKNEKDRAWEEIESESRAQTDEADAEIERLEKLKDEANAQLERLV